jgi:hypothetical protein
MMLMTSLLCSHPFALHELAVAPDAQKLAGVRLEVVHAGAVLLALTEAARVDVAAAVVVGALAVHPVLCPAACIHQDQVV